MHILLTNDDGIQAPGLAFLYEQLAGWGEVTVVAPDRCRSGVSHTISLGPVHCETVRTDFFSGYAVSGSPADCVKLAVREITGRPFDLVVSGINVGANAGVNIHYSGTVAAATEAVLQGLPAAALSAAVNPGAPINPEELKSSCAFGARVLEKLLPLPRGTLININIPGLGGGKVKGVKITGQSGLPYKEKYRLLSNENGRKTYQIDGFPDCTGPEENDVAWLEQNYITVTALHLDRTDYGHNRRLEKINFTSCILGPDH
jgi:5'-nucleotidase